MATLEGLPTRYTCPMADCSWFYDEPAALGGYTTLPMSKLSKHALDELLRVKDERTEGLLEDHVSTHDRQVWMAAALARNDELDRSSGGP